MKLTIPQRLLSKHKRRRPPKWWPLAVAQQYEEDIALADNRERCQEGVATIPKPTLETRESEEAS